MPVKGESKQWHEWPAIVKSNLKSIFVFVKHSPGAPWYIGKGSRFSYARGLVIDPGSFLTYRYLLCPHLSPLNQGPVISNLTDYQLHNSICISNLAAINVTIDGGRYNLSCIKWVSEVIRIAEVAKSSIDNDMDTLYK